MNVEFKYKLDDIVVNPLGGSGIIAMLGVEKSGNTYYVKAADGSGGWWEEGQLTPGVKITE